MCDQSLLLESPTNSSILLGGLLSAVSASYAILESARKRKALRERSGLIKPRSHRIPIDTSYAQTADSRPNTTLHLANCSTVIIILLLLLKIVPLPLPETDLARFGAGGQTDARNAIRYPLHGLSSNLPKMLETGLAGQKLAGPRMPTIFFFIDRTWSPISLKKIQKVQDSL
ncbi:hypothetical protein F4777DRAFT_379179 [Nemania sp. FL0916]|nr:hypothetical protein F4777DRAFT_379179 [Nemania sp. FL0916]